MNFAQPKRFIHTKVQNRFHKSFENYYQLTTKNTFFLMTKL